MCIHADRLALWEETERKVARQYQHACILGRFQPFLCHTMYMPLLGTYVLMHMYVHLTSTYTWHVGSVHALFLWWLYSCMVQMQALHVWNMSSAHINESGGSTDVSNAYMVFLNTMHYMHMYIECSNTYMQCTCMLWCLSIEPLVLQLTCVDLCSYICACI